MNQTNTAWGDHQWRLKVKETWARKRNFCKDPRGSAALSSSEQLNYRQRKGEKGNP